MKKLYYVFLAGMLLCPAFTAQAQNAAPQYEELTGLTVTGMSPDGKTVVGSASAYAPDNYRSFVWNADTKETQWMTSYDESDLDKSGAFKKVTDQGVIVGSMRDKDLNVDIPGDDWSPGRTIYLTTAAVWKDGKTYKLGIGPNDKDVFSDEADGSYASGVSADGSIVTGYLQYQYFPQLACGWKYEQSTDTYSYFRYALPEGTSMSATNGVSADGTVAVGQAFYDGYYHAIVWTSEADYKVITLGVEGEQGVRGNAVAVSPDGRYVLVCVNSYTEPKVGVYDVQNDATEIIPLTDVYEINGMAIDNSGSFFCKIMDSNEYLEKTYYYSSANKMFIDMAYYVQQFAPGIDGLPDMNSAQPVAVSADGSRVAGNISSGYTSNGWWLSVNSSAAMVAAVTGVKAYTSGIDRVTIQWNELAGLEEGVTVKEYNLYDNGVVFATVAPGTDVQDGVYKHVADMTAGSHSFTVKATCLKDGEEIASSESDAATAVVPQSYEIPMTDDFESTGFNQNSWETELAEGSAAEVLNWNVSGGDYENNTYYASVSSTTYNPYTAVLYSRFFDASELQSVYLTYYGKMAYVNQISENLNSDYFDVEYSTDGENWKTVNSLCAADVKLTAWNFTNLDLSSELAGKQFKLRFVARGEGMATLKWYLDYVTVGKELYQQKPEGLQAVKGDGKTELTWKNSIGAYELSYVANSNVLTNYNIGNEGSPLIVAVSFPADYISSHVGQYISSVTSFIYDDPSFGSLKATQAEAIVYADGKEVARQAFADNVANEPVSATAALSSPVKIEAGKEYKVAVRIHDYDSQQTPLYYQSSESSLIAGRTDLYSEDEGKTWSLISDFNAGNEDQRRAWCVWPIRANITADATPQDASLKLDSKLLAYNVYRDGVRINDMPVYSAYMKYTDENPAEGAEYTVQAFYTDGRVSVISDPVTAQTSAIGGVNAGGSEAFTVNAASGSIDLSADLSSARLVSVDGRAVASASGSCISTSSLTPGVYILKAERAGKPYACKVLVK